MTDFYPKESSDYLGYYEIPGYSKYVISREGDVINKDKGTVLLGSINPAGYKNYRLTGNNKHIHTWGRHRLMGFVFKYPGMDITDLVINHKNAIKGDDFLDNLEWVTYQGNAEHAGSLNLTEKCQPISVRDIDTGIVTKYPSIIACAIDMGVSKDTINWRIKAGETRIFPERKQYRSSHSDIPWYYPENIDSSLDANGLAKHILVRNVLTGKISSYMKLSDLAYDLDIYPSIITQWIKKPNQPVLPGFIQIKLRGDSTPWRQICDPYVELEKTTKRKSVKTFNNNTGEIRIFTSASECAEVMGISQTALNYRLKTEGKSIFSDGYSYSYYSSNVRSL